MIAAFGLLAGAADANDRLRISVVSSQPDRVTNGDALFAVDLPARLAPRKVGVRLNGVSVRSSFSTTDGNPRRLTGRLAGIRRGASTVSAWARGRNAATVRIFNSPRTGPVFSGPHQNPFICRTVQNGLGEPVDENCSATTRVDYYYRDQGGEIKPLASPDLRPVDLSQTTLPDGRTVDYVIRMESGTINRAVYRWAMLDPGNDLRSGWNGSFVFRHGGGCTAGYQQGQASTDFVLDDLFLKRGFAMLASSLNVMGTACNDVLSAESASMVKEHVIESLGRAPKWTIGTGGSGGSMLIQMASQNYPGLFDGILPSASFPDNSLVVQPHCRLLYNYFDSPEAAGFSAAQRVSITGIPVEDSCRGLGSNTANVINATDGCSNAVPAELIFDPLSNPGGIRCTIFDSLVNIYGKDPATGHARRAVDNVGRQYGLQALQEGVINLNRFLNLNEDIGGFDQNGNFSAQRAEGDVDAIETAYRTGRVNRGMGGTAGVPIIDVRNWADGANNVHISVPAYEFRERIRAANGSVANHVMFRARGAANVGPMDEASVDVMTEWLDRIKADNRSVPLSQKVVANKPAAATDACWVDGARHNEPAGIGLPGICNDEYPAFSTPDLRAGKPLGSNVVKCQLKPVVPSDYGTPNQAQINRLAAIFPQGVCDWNRPGIGEVPLAGTDLSFGPSHSVATVRRNLSLRVKPKRVRATKRGRSVRVTAALRPCPVATWQPVVFERTVRRGKRTIWKRAAVKPVTGSRCQARIRVGKIRANTRIRARARSLSGFRFANSPARTVRVKRRN